VSRISVIIPVFNAHNFIGAAVQSLLDQTYENWEALIFDDASTDGSWQILEGFHDKRIHLVRSEENRGYAHWLNRGLQAASGEFIARLDADDISRRDRFERQIQAFRDDPGLVLAGSQTIWIDEADMEIGRKLYPETDVAIRWELLFDNPFCHPAVMMRAAVLREHGLLYREDLLPSEDFELWTRLLRYGSGKNFPEPLLRYRVHAGQISSTRRANQLQHHDTVVRSGKRCAWSGKDSFLMTCRTELVQNNSWHRRPICTMNSGGGSRMPPP